MQHKSTPHRNHCWKEVTMHFGLAKQCLHLNTQKRENSKLTPSIVMSAMQTFFSRLFMFPGEFLKVKHIFLGKKTSAFNWKIMKQNVLQKTWSSFAHLAECNSHGLDIFPHSLPLTPPVQPWASRLQQREYKLALQISLVHLHAVYYSFEATS